MNYKKVIAAEFISRPNRFIANVIINGKTETVHVKNTGRCRELLIPGCTVYLSCSDNPKRKTKYDIIAVIKERNARPPLLINMDSQIPNDVAMEWLKQSNLFSENAEIKREVKYGNSRFDFYIKDGSRKIFLEVKGVTLEQDGIAMFPDAPTERGIKHINELISCIKDGFEAYLLFVIQMKGACEFRPNNITHPQFGQALLTAEQKGVKIIVMDCIVTENSMKIDSPVKYIL